MHERLLFCVSAPSAVVLYALAKYRIVVGFLFIASIKLCNVLEEIF